MKERLHRRSAPKNYRFRLMRLMSMHFSRNENRFNFCSIPSLRLSRARADLRAAHLRARRADDLIANCGN